MAACLYRRKCAGGIVFITEVTGMKKIVYILLAVLCIACVGQKEDVLESDLQFEADKVLLSVNDNESAVFSVLFNGLDVTAESDIFEITDGTAKEFDGQVFTPSEAGDYKFQAYYCGVPTPVLNIQAVKGGGEKGNFLKRWMIMKFTATWCVNCPNMSETIKSVKNEFPGRVIDVAVHYIDDFQVSSGKKYAEYFNVSAIPVAVVNLDKTTQTSVASATLLANNINKVVDANLPTCGIKIGSAKQDGKLVVDVESTVTGDGKYKLAVAILQDGLVKAQTGAGADYVHNSVLRGMLQQDAMGESLGECKAGDVIQKRYECSAGDFDATGTYRIVAFILKECQSGTYLVNNITECKLYGSADYMYEVLE